MEFGIQVQSTDGVQTNLNFKTARFIEIVSVQVANDPVTFVLPASFILGTDVYFVLEQGFGSIINPHVVTEDIPNNSLHYTLRSGYSFNSGAYMTYNYSLMKMS